ncbi:uncharacterized protein LOC105178187 [Sesamum indicum]|uniref:Uncharacterized protein LOC105178187 n=1 Tax=Sesamum indicum TaxID=4182 RepID=A0A6I9UF17_SESIN|nr:uncharacterized protein LOC105178187 [Sesamum indicum]XP_011099899.1 uncharacterized protein LOC105178187 [Sesamum indicum]
MAKKKFTSMRHVGGLEAPRNSSELPVETSYGLYAGRDSVLYSCHLTNCYSTEAPIKKLISEEISKRPNTRQNGLSIVARLMGVDMLPFDLGQAPKIVEKNNETPAPMVMDKERSKKGSVVCDQSTTCSSTQPDFGSFGYNFDRYSDHFTSRINLKKPKPREHPQEQELQKFKKDFEAWQATRFKECSKVVDISNDPTQWIAKDDLKREKVFLYANSQRVTTRGRLMEPNNLSVTAGPHEILTSCNSEKKKDHTLAGVEESPYSDRMPVTELRTSQLTNADHQWGAVSAPTKIVILRPGPDKIGVSEEDSWNGTPCTSAKRGSIEDFLEEVKERLKLELQGKSSKSTATRGGTESRYQEKPSQPRQIAQCIAQKMRDSVSKDLEVNLLRSESARSYSSDIQLNGTGHPEFISRDTRRSLTERLRNVLKGEIHTEIPTVSTKSSRSLSVLDYEKRAEKSRHIWIDDKMGCSESCMNDIEKQSRSFRQDPCDGGMHNKELSPGNLIRSLSAPVSGTFGKLLLEDRHILTGAQIRRKHEIVENISMSAKKKKDKFNIREKVSSFRYSFTLRGRLLHRRVQSVDDLHYNKHDLYNDVTSGPTVTWNFCETNENSTEVPPSPASVCSTPCEEFGRPADHTSQTSSGVLPLEDSEMLPVFHQINSDLNESEKKLNQPKCTGLKETKVEEPPHEVETDIDNPAEAYIRDLLVASGLYDGSCIRSPSKWGPHCIPISHQVFEEVEESYRQSTEVDERCSNQEAKLNRKMILDLLNEALPAVLGEPANTVRYMEKAIDPAFKPPHGRKLVSRVWESIRVYVHPSTDRSVYVLDNMVARDLKSKTWSRLMDEGKYVMGENLGSEIAGDLIEEMVQDMYLRSLEEIAK